MAALTLFIAIASAEMFNQSTWQRVWAAESVPAMKKGFYLGSLLVFLLMMFFGIMGMIAYAKDPLLYDSGPGLRFLAFFDLLMPLAGGWHVMVLIMITALTASSMDSLQNALTCVFSRDIIRLGADPVWVCRFLVVVINVPAVFMSTFGYDVIALFLVADLVCATAVLPLFLGMQTEDFGPGKIFVAPTELGAFFGCLGGVITVIGKRE